MFGTKRASTELQNNFSEYYSVNLNLLINVLENSGMSSDDIRNPEMMDAICILNDLIVSVSMDNLSESDEVIATNLLTNIRNRRGNKSLLSDKEYQDTLLKCYGVYYDKFKANGEVIVNDLRAPIVACIKLIEPITSFVESRPSDLFLHSLISAESVLLNGYFKFWDSHL